MGDIDAALEALKSLKTGKKVNYAQVAREFDVNRVTLSRRHRAVQGTRASKYEKMRLLNTAQEKELVSYIDRLSARGLPPSRAMVRNFASEIATKQVGKNWADKFVARHNIDLISK